MQYPTSAYEQAATTIELMAQRLEHTAEELPRIAVTMREHDDASQAAEAASAITNLVGNLPLDRMLQQSLNGSAHSLRAKST